MKYLLCCAVFLLLFAVATYEVLVQENLLKPIPELLANAAQMRNVCADMKTYRHSLGHPGVTDDELARTGGFLAWEVSEVQRSRPIICSGWKQSEVEDVIREAFRRSPLMKPVATEINKADISKN